MATSQRYQSDSSDAAPLGQPLKFEFSGKVAKNRFMKAAMTEQLSSWDPKDLKARGVPSQELINVYKIWGEGEFGVILSGNIMIDYDQLEASGNPIISLENPFSGERFERQKELAKAAKAHGSLFIAQVSHPGRQVEENINAHPISASNVQLGENSMGKTFAEPRAATQEDIDDVVKRFGHAAEYLEKAGYDGVQLHGAHGYLISQFLSETTNQRTDRYGGSIENRARIIVEIAQEIRKKTSPDFSLSIKLNSVEFQDKGITPEEAKQVVAILEENKFDFVELSGGTYQQTAFLHKKESTRKRESYFLEFAETIVPALSKTKSYVTGGLKSVGAMVKSLDTVDGVGLGRPATAEPHLPKDILSGKVTGAIKPLVNPDEQFGVTLALAGAQIRQLGMNVEPIDLSRQENHDAFMKDLTKWAGAKAEDKQLKRYGHVVIESVKSVPYGTAVA